MSTLEKVRNVIDDLALAPLPEDTETSLFESGVIDSFSVVYLVGRLEQAFGIAVPDEDVMPRRFETLAKITAYVEARAKD